MVENIWCATFKASYKGDRIGTACHLQVIEIYYHPLNTLPIKVHLASKFFFAKIIKLSFCSNLPEKIFGLVALFFRPC